MYYKSSAMQRIHETLSKIGYADDRLIKDYAVTTSGNNVLKFDLVAFADDSVHDTTTSCISVKWCKDKNEKQKYIDDVKYIATPVFIVPEIEKVEIWNVKKDTSTCLFKLKYDELYPHFQEHRFDFSSNSIIEAKYGFRQLTLFDTLGLLDFAENANYHMLGEEFKTALFTGKNILDYKKIKGDDNYRALTSITMHILGAVILKHKLNPNETIDSIHSLLGNLSEIYNDYFNKEYIYKFGKDTVERIFESLNKSIIYRNVNNEMLGYFYESTLFGKTELDKDKIRKTYGIYYTPKVLGDDILNHIPIEFIPEHERVTLDGSCGSGSLLISAYKRLEKVLDVNWTAKQKHDYLTQNINGIDIDRFAREVARLSLLLYSLPNGNSWNVITGDTLKIDKFTKMKYPMIIIGNPPFQETRKGSQKQKAVEFVKKYIDWLKPNGYFGIILPESFLENNSGRDVRKNLLENIDILEIWSMPGTIFKNNCATTVIIGKKVKKEASIKYPTKIRIVSRESDSIRRYLENRNVDFEFFYPDQKQWLNNKKTIINYSPLKEIIDKIVKFEKIGTLADYIQGINIPNNDKYPFISKIYKDGFGKYLQNARKCFSSYYVNWELQSEFKFVKYDDSLVKEFPNIRLRMAYKSIFENEKILVKQSSTPGTFWRIVAAIDREICYPSKSFYCIIPKDDRYSKEEMIAVINSKLVNAYVGSLSVKRTILVDAIKSIPLPVFSVDDKQQIINKVRMIENLKRTKTGKNEIENLINELDIIINKAFGLNESEIELLSIYYQKRVGKFISKESEKLTKFDCNLWNYIGEILDVDVENKLLKVSFVETTDFKTVKITNNLPGWMIRKGANFTADIPDVLINKDVWELFNVKPLENAYMNEDDLYSFIETRKDSCTEVVL